MARFKPGDKVCNMSDDWPTAKARGNVYTVKEVRESGCFAECIKFHELDEAFPNHFRYSRNYELVPFQVAAPEPAFDLLAAMTGRPLKFRSGCAVKFVAYSPDAKPHCQLVLLNPSTGNIVTRYANGKSSEEPYNEPGDILNVEAA